jgi:hypothetical protein
MWFRFAAAKADYNPRGTTRKYFKFRHPFFTLDTMNDIILSKKTRSLAVHIVSELPTIQDASGPSDFFRVRLCWTPEAPVPPNTPYPLTNVSVIDKDGNLVSFAHALLTMSYPNSYLSARTARTLGLSLTEDANIKAKILRTRGGRAKCESCATVSYFTDLSTEAEQLLVWVFEDDKLDRCPPMILGGDFFKQYLRKLILLSGVIEAIKDESYKNMITVKK